MKVKVIIAVIMGIIGYYIASNLITGLEGEGLSPAGEAVFSLLPIVIAMVMIIMGMVAVVGGEKIYYILKWNDLGSRMKEAYSAKFGGENPAFNTEVDMHIHVVRTLGKKSWTKDVNVDWVKRMCEFVEIPFIVPEEEHYSEEEKTEMFGDKQ